MLTERDNLILQFIVYTGILDVAGAKRDPLKVVLEYTTEKLLYEHCLLRKDTAQVVYVAIERARRRILSALN